MSPEYDEILWPNELYINNKFKTHADYLCGLIKRMILDPRNPESIYATDGTYATTTFMQYIYSYQIGTITDYDESKVIPNIFTVCR